MPERFSLISQLHHLAGLFPFPDLSFLRLEILVHDPFQELPVAGNDFFYLPGQLVELVFFRIHSSTPFLASARRYNSSYFTADRFHE